MNKGDGVFYRLFSLERSYRTLIIVACCSLLFLSLTLTLTLSPASELFAGERKPVAPHPKDKCPVCGMFVKKYPDWVAEVIFRDGSYAVFDGAKDMFKYYFNMKKYNPSKNMADIDALYVTDYYSLTLIDGKTAYYVIESDVKGPMGRELVPFENEADAKEFMKDHKGEKILRFGDVTLQVIKTLDRDDVIK